jgi:predicted enzyme related to lactoylglutathione lyase
MVSARGSAQFPQGPVTRGLADRESFEDPPAWSVYFAVTDAEATTKKVEGAGGRVVVPLWT